VAVALAGPYASLHIAPLKSILNFTTNPADSIHLQKQKMAHNSSNIADLARSAVALGD